MVYVRLEMTTAFLRSWNMPMLSGRMPQKTSNASHLRQPVEVFLREQLRPHRLQRDWIVNLPTALVRERLPSPCRVGSLGICHGWKFHISDGRYEFNVFSKSRGSKKPRRIITCVIVWRSRSIAEPGAILACACVGAAVSAMSHAYVCGTRRAPYDASGVFGTTLPKKIGIQAP